MASVRAPQRHVTRSGLALQIRPATAYDGRALQKFFDQVSDDDRRYRFQHAVTRLDADQLEAFIGVDHNRCESFLVFEMAGGQLVAAAQFACDEARDTAEIAVSVHRDYKGLGIGSLMLDLLAAEAERCGVRRIASVEDRENYQAIDLEREKGFMPVTIAGDPARVVLSKLVA